MEKPVVTLREVRDEDLPVFFAQQLDPMANWMAAFTSENPSDREAFDAHWIKIRGRDTIQNRTILADREVAGYLASFLREDLREVSYWLGKDYWGRGIATEALRLFLEEWTERPIYARAAADNAASLRVLEKCGFVIIAEEHGFAAARGQEIKEYLLARTV